MASTLNATTTNGLVTSADNSGSLQLQTNNGTTAVTIDTSQNVGIGTSSPSLKLDVIGAIRINEDGAGTKVIQVRSNWAGVDPAINVQTNNPLLFNTNGTERMRIDSSGRLLVGTTAVTTSSGQSGEIYSTGATGFMMTNSTAANYALAVKNEGTSGTRNLINFYEGSAGGTARANVSFDSSANTFIKTSGATDLLLGTNNTERMRITSSGVVCVGTTSQVGSGKTVVAYDSGSFVGIAINQTNAGAAGYLMSFRLNGTEVGSIYQNTSTTAYNTSSDYRLKENIAPMTGALNKVLQLKPCTYTWKSTGEAGEGFIAHELQAVVPDAVTGEKDAVNEDGSIKPQGIDTSFLVATLTSAIQELKAELDTVKAELNTLKNPPVEGTE